MLRRQSTRVLYETSRTYAKELTESPLVFIEVVRDHAARTREEIKSYCTERPHIAFDFSDYGNASSWHKRGAIKVSLFFLPADPESRNEIGDILLHEFGYSPIKRVRVDALPYSLTS